MDPAVLAAIVAFLVVVLLVILYLSVRIVQQYEQMVVFRLGKTGLQLVKGPGVVFLIPIVARPVRILRQEGLTLVVEPADEPAPA